MCFWLSYVETVFGETKVVDVVGCLGCCDLLDVVLILVCAKAVNVDEI